MFSWQRVVVIIALCGSGIGAIALGQPMLAMGAFSAAGALVIPAHREGNENFAQDGGTPIRKKPPTIPPPNYPGQGPLR